MKMPQMTRIAPAALLALALALPASAAITSREDNLAAPRGWSAMAGMDPHAVAEMARSLPLSDQAADDQPWCDHRAEVERTLTHDFGEEKIATAARGMVLWGSELMGTWTMVLDFSPTFAIKTGPWNHSYAALVGSKECVLAIPTVDLIDKVISVGTSSGKDTDKFEAFGLARQPARPAQGAL